MNRKTRVLNSKFPKGIYAIIEKDTLNKNDIKRLDISCLQIRKKNRPSLSLIKDIKKIKRKFKNLNLIVNDRPDAALAACALGVHVGKGDLPVKVLRRILGKDFIIGKTVRDLREALKAQKEGAGYISLGPIYRTPFKKMIKPKGLKVLKEVRNKVSTPLIAVGGINFSNKDSVLASGADGVAMIRAVSQKSKVKSQKHK